MNSLKSISKRLFAVILTATMLLTVFPFMGMAADIEYVDFGTYEQDGDTTNGEEPIKWIVLETLADGSKLLISDKILDAQKFNATATGTWAESDLRTWLNGTFMSDAFSPAEQAFLSDRTFAYVSGATGTTAATQTTSDDTCKVSLLSRNDFINYFNTDKPYQAKRAAEKTDVVTTVTWWLCDVWTSTSAAQNCKKAHSITNTGYIKGGNANNFNPTMFNTLGVGINTVNGVRPVILVKALPNASFTATPHVTFTDINGTAITSAVVANDYKFKITLDAAFSNSALTVTYTPKEGTAVTIAPADGVYTIPASTVDVTVNVTGVQANPADFTAYDEAVASAGTLPHPQDFYTEESFAVLTAALNVDVSGYKADQQAAIDAQAAAIESAIESLVLKDADYTEFDAALAAANAILADANYITDGNTPSYNLKMTVHGAAAKRGKKIDQQADIDSYTVKMVEQTAAMVLKSASIGVWTSASSDATATKPFDCYKNYNEITDLVAALYTEFELGTPDPEMNLTDQLQVIGDYFMTLKITEQSVVDDAAARLLAAVAKLELKPADYTALDESIALAETYTTDMFTVEVEACQQAWDSFEIQLKKAKELSRELTADNQSEVDKAKAALDDSMNSLNNFIKLSKFEQWWLDTTTKFKEFVALMKIVNKVLKIAIPMLFRGEIDIKALIDGTADWEDLVADILAKL